MIMRLSTEKRYRVADSMASAFRNLSQVERNSAFGVIINSPIKLNGEFTTLKKAFSSEIAIHITNLTLKRVQGSVAPEISL